ncbi:MAG: hypothetical protein R3D27_03635 [Hyphomicrobiaceae bacterium]
MTHTAQHSPTLRPAARLRSQKAMLPVMLAAAFALSAGPALAQDAAGEKGRYTMSPVDNGFVRLDTRTGAMSFCTRSDGRWSCEAMADAGADLRQEAERLRKENTDLRAEIKRLDDMLGLGDGRPGERAPRQGFRIPTEKDVDQALDYFERMLKKFQDRLKRLEEKPGEPGTGGETPPPAKPDAAPQPGRKTAL